MTYSEPDTAVTRQWEAKVARWANRGRSRQEILEEMGHANWPYEDAVKLLARVGSRERRKWILLMIGCAALLIFGLGITYVSVTSRSGGVIYVPFSGGIGFIYGLVRLVKLRI